jgi:uncharacterized protein YkwD
MMAFGISPPKGAVRLPLSGQERELYDLIMDYRGRRGLESISISPSLTYVARVHARDLAENRPFDDYCNLHSWSDSGDWTACCYTDDHRESSCMWFKPYELTGFRGIGYEIVYYSTFPEDHVDFPNAVIEGWKASKSHNQVIINRGEWKSLEWKSIGIAVNGPFAVVWFSDTGDGATELHQRD